MSQVNKEPAPASLNRRWGQLYRYGKYELVEEEKREYYGNARYEEAMEGMAHCNKRYNYARPEPHSGPHRCCQHNAAFKRHWAHWAQLCCKVHACLQAGAAFVVATRCCQLEAASSWAPGGGGGNPAQSVFASEQLSPAWAKLGPLGGWATGSFFPVPQHGALCD